VSPARAPRPTIRCLKEDLGFAKLPPATEPLDQADHVLVGKAREVCRTDPPAGEPISEIDDRVLWKVKIGRWRGALWCDGPGRWLLAAGYRRAGDADDFYAELGVRARRWRADYNRVHSPPLKTDTWTDALLPGRDDEERLTLEAAVLVVDDVRQTVRGLTLESARTGAEATDETAGCELGVLVRRSELGEVYVGIRIIGPAKPEMHAVVLDAVPAVTDRNGWFPDSMPGRATRPGEIVWSNLLDADELDGLLLEQP
jgi:hypothetical protein